MTTEHILTRKCLAEFLGTFCMVFAGCGAIVINDLHGGVIGHMGIALTFGLVVMAMIYTLGDISGAHLNPAVSVGFWLARRFPGREVLPYAAAQTAGAVAAAGVLKILFSSHATLGATIPAAGMLYQSLLLEVILTWVLMFVILNVSTDGKETGLMAGVAVGGVIALEALFAGPVCGASMNPARSLGPALLSGAWQPLWIYFIAPLVGAALAVPTCRGVQAAGCCSMREGNSCA